MLACRVNKTQCEVEIGFGKVQRLVRCDQLERQVGLVRGIGSQARLEPFGGDVARRGDGQRAAGLACLHRPHGIFKLQETGA